jgi:hypothetical protein
MLQDYPGTEFQPWLRAQIDLIESQQPRQFLGGRPRLRVGVLKHVHLHSAMEARYSGAVTQSTRAELRSAGFKRELVVATVHAIQKLVAGLSWRPRTSQWAGYQDTCDSGTRILYAVASRG